MDLRKIIKEEMDWIEGIESALPDKNILEETVPVVVTLREFLNTQYSYNFIDIILEDGRMIELQMEGDYDVTYYTYKSPQEAVYSQGLSNPWVEDGPPTEFNQAVMEDYLREFNMEEVSQQVDSVLRKLIPLDIKGIYVGDL